MNNIREKFLTEIWPKFDPSTGEHITTGDEIADFFLSKMNEREREIRKKMQDAVGHMNGYYGNPKAREMVYKHEVEALLKIEEEGGKKK